MQEQNNKQGLLKTLGPGKSFGFGALFGFMIVTTIGFFMLLVSGVSLTNSVADSDNSGTVFGAATNTNTAVKTAPAAQPTAQIDIQPVTSDDHVRGNLEKAEVVIVEFSDTECPFCQRFHPTMQQVAEEYGDQVAWVYRHFPLDSLHPKARKEAEATECAAELGGNDGFWAYTDRLYEVTPSNNGLPESQLAEIATEVGLDSAKFQDCLDSGKYADKVQSHVQDAMASGGNGTPYSVAISLDGQIVPINGAQLFSSVKSTIDSLLN